MNTTVRYLLGATPDPEQEFLPAALEVQQTPPAPLGRIILWAIIIFFILSAIWAAMGSVDIVAVAQGKVIPSDRVKIIQPLETGVIKTILVKEGQWVEEGEALIELDRTQTQADRDQLQGQRQKLVLDRARLTTLISILDGKILPKVMGDYFYQQLLDASVENHFTIQQYQQQLTQQYLEYTSQQQSLQEQYKQNEADISATNNRIAQLNSTIPLMTERVQAIASMMKKNLAPRAQWLELEQEHIEQLKERDIQKDNYRKLDAVQEGIKQQQINLTAQTQATWLGELNEVTNQLQGVEQELKKAQQRSTLQTLASPINGRVQQLSVHTIGGVVTSAQELLRIIPQDNQLEVEAFIENKDIGFVEEGQIVEVKLEAFPFTKYGTLDGKITTISYDAIQSEQQGLIYSAQVSLKQSTIMVNGKPIPIAPGMVATAEVKTGKRKIIEYVLSPLLRYKSESVRER